MAGVTTKTIREWTNDRKVKKIGYGKYDFAKVLPVVLAWDTSGGLRNSQGTEAISDEEMKTNKALLEKAKADMAETEVGIERRTLINKADMGGYTVNLMTILKRELLGMSRVLPSYLYGLSESEMEEKITQHLQKVMWTLMEGIEMQSLLDYLDSLNV